MSPCHASNTLHHVILSKMDAAYLDDPVLNFVNHEIVKLIQKKKK